MAYRTSANPPMARPVPRPRMGNRRVGREFPSFAQKLRISLIWGLLCLAVVGLIGRLAYLQLWQQETLSAIAQQQQAHKATPVVTRRPILDSQGTLVAVDRLVYSLYAHPVLFRQPISVVAQTLSSFLDKPTETLATQLKAAETGVRLQDEIPADVGQRLQRLHLDGLELLPTHQRFYPQQELFSQIVGFVNLDGEAQTGIEARHQDRLQLAEPSLLPSYGAAAPVSNASDHPQLGLQLTLDNRLQRVAQDALAATLEQFGAARGTVMVMDVHSGALHAFAVAPTFDPNRYFDADLAWLKNWAITDVFEPGSTFKPINLAIALEAQAIAPDGSVFDAGRITMDDWIIQNADYEAAGGRGPLSLSDVLKHSSNVGMVRIMEQLPAADYYQWLKTLEIDQPTQIELPAESAAPLKSKFQFVNSPVDVATAAFGQGIVLTPLKLLQLQAAIANGGQLVTPHVLKGLVNEAGALTWQPLRPAPRQVFSADTAQTVLTMMETVVEDGTGQSAQIPGYRVAGKTGTAQKVNSQGRYGDGRIVSFVGLLPVEAPRFGVLAVIDEPWGEIVTGSAVAAPLVKTVSESLLVLEGIPPSAPQALGGVMVPP